MDYSPYFMIISALSLLYLAAPLKATYGQGEWATSAKSFNSMALHEKRVQANVARITLPLRLTAYIHLSDED